jgi:glycosyltransferase involved in cell wall biosynthesis
MSRPYITALIDTYNHERFIEQAVLSVLEQDFPASEMEVLVVDDGSSDSTPEILSRFAPQIRVLRKSNGGQGSAFNFAIPEARGEIISFLDGDDWWAQGKLARVAEVLRAEPEVGILGHGTTEVHPDGSHHTEILRENFRLRADTVEGARLFRLRKSFFGTRMSMRSAVARNILPVPDALIIEADEFLFTLAVVSANALILPESLLFYRIHEGNLFHATKFAAEGMRRRQKVMAKLAAELEREIRHRGLSAEVIRTIVEPVQREADQFRLILDGGWPWEAVRTEWRLFRIHCEEATTSHRFFKCATLASALLLPPRTYYAAKGWLAHNPMYRRSRQKWLPIPIPQHVKRIDGTGI